MQTAQILVEQGRYLEADTHYDQALQAARRVGDKDLEGTALQHQGGLADDMNQYNRATDLYTQALKLFQDANDDGAVMQTCNLLGVVEDKQGRLSEARSWYERSHEIAKRRGDFQALGAAAHNIGIVCQLNGKAARQRGDETMAQQQFAEAERSLQESLELAVERRNQPGEARSRSQLAQLYLVTGELDKAEAHAHQARQIMENLAMKEVAINYATLANIARARGDASQAAQWEARRDEARAELTRRAQGGDTSGVNLSQQMIEAITQLAVACIQAGLNGSALSSDAESAVAQLQQSDAGPLPSLGPYLRRLTTGPADETLAALASPPADLPPPLPQRFAQLRDAVREADGG